MSKKKTITTESLNRAMKSSNQRAIRTNKALGLDTVYIKGKTIIREHADGRTSTIQKLKDTTYKANTIKSPLKID